MDNILGNLVTTPQKPQLRDLGTAVIIILDVAEQPARAAREIALPRSLGLGDCDSEVGDCGRVVVVVGGD